jgi:hypothetical protein
MEDDFGVGERENEGSGREGGEERVWAHRPGHLSGERERERKREREREREKRKEKRKRKRSRKGKHHRNRK